MATALIQPSFAAGELAPSLLARTDLAKFHVGARRLRNMFVHAHGGASNRPGTLFVGRVKDTGHPVRLIGFQYSTSQTYVLEFGHLYLRVIKDGGYVLEPAKAITAISAAGTITAPGHGFGLGDQLFVADVALAAGLNSTPSRQYLVAGTTTDTVTLTDLDGHPVAPGGAYGGGGTVARVYTLTTPYAGSDLAMLKFTQSADVMTLCHPSYPPQDLSRTQHWVWTLAAVTFAPSIAAPSGVRVAPSSSGGWNFAYAVTAETDIPAEESRGSAIVPCTNAQLNQNSGIQNIVSWQAQPGAARYKIYKASPVSGAAIVAGAMFGYIGTATGTSFIDLNISPDFTQTPPQGRNPFADGAGNPGVVNYHEQRKIFAGSAKQPQTLWMTQPGSYRNMDTSSPTRDSDAITVTIAASQVNAIRHIVPMASLLVLTSGGAWKMSGGSQSSVLTPSQTVVTPQAYAGCSDVPPIVINTDILYVQSKGSVVRSLSYNFYADVYTGADMSVLSNHLFYGYTIREWAYAEEPFKLVWAVRSDGAVLTFTYLKEQDVYAWTHCASPGFSGTDQCLSVASVPEGDEDAVYFVMRRTIPGTNGGQPVQYVERLASRNMMVGGRADVTRAWFVDCGLRYCGPPTTIVSGLDHLEGCTVAILADGNDAPRQTVTNGRISIQHPAGTITVGLPFRSLLQTLPLDVGGATTIQGKRKQLPAVTVRLENSRGMRIGPDLDSMAEPKERKPTLPYGQAIPLFTGDERVIIPSTWTTDGSIWIEQTEPLPLTVLGLIPEVRVGDG